MSWFAFTAMHPVKAARELREAGHNAYAVMMIDRRKRHRHRAKGTAVWEPKAVVALRGYVFLQADIPNLWAIGKMRHVSQPVRFCGRLRPIPDSQLAAILSERGEYFRDDDPPKALLRKAPVGIVAGDSVRFDFGCEAIDAPVMSVDGETLLVKLNRMILGRDTMRIKTALVERVS
jgi:transcription antitermination factor NusG